MNRRIRLALEGLALAVIVLVLAEGVTRHLVERPAELLAFDLPEGPANETLVEWTHQANMQTLFDYSAMQDRFTHAIKGHFTVAEAARRMVRETGIEFEPVNRHTVVFSVCAPHSMSPGCLEHHTNPQTKLPDLSPDGV